MIDIPHLTTPVSRFSDMEIKVEKEIAIENEKIVEEKIEIEKKPTVWERMKSFFGFSK